VHRTDLYVGVNRENCGKSIVSRLPRVDYRNYMAIAANGASSVCWLRKMLPRLVTWFIGDNNAIVVHEMQVDVGFQTGRPIHSSLFIQIRLRYWNG